METTSAIVLRSIEYGDKDKILYLFSPDDGVFSAKLRGVKQQGAKMKIFSLPFCFAEWELVGGKSKDFYTVKGARLIESFYNISSDIDRYCVACIMLDVLRCNVYYEDNSNNLIFMSLLKGLRLLNFTKVNAKLILCKFLLDVLRFNGMQLQVDTCGKCGVKLTSSVFLGREGLIKCSECHLKDDLPLDNAVVSCVKNLDSIEYESLGGLTVKQEVIDRAMVVVRRNVETRLQISLSFTEII